MDCESHSEVLRVLSCRKRPHPHEQRAVHRQGALHRRVSLQTGASVHLQAQPGCGGPLQCAENGAAGHGEQGEQLGLKPG